MSHLQLPPVLVPADLLDRMAEDAAAEDGGLVQIHDLAGGIHPGLQRTLDGEVHLDPLGADRVVHDADVDAGVLDQELMDDQNLKVVFDAGRG